MKYESEEPVAVDFNCPKKFGLLLLVHSFTFLDPKKTHLLPPSCAFGISWRSDLS